MTRLGGIKKLASFLTPVGVPGRLHCDIRNEDCRWSKKLTDDEELRLMA